MCVWCGGRGSDPAVPQAPSREISSFSRNIYIWRFQSSLADTAGGTPKKKATADSIVRRPHSIRLDRGPPPKTPKQTKQARPFRRRRRLGSIGQPGSLSCNSNFRCGGSNVGCVRPIPVPPSLSFSPPPSPSPNPPTQSSTAFVPSPPPSFAVCCSGVCFVVCFRFARSVCSGFCIWHACLFFFPCWFGKTNANCTRVAALAACTKRWAAWCGCVVVFGVYVRSSRPTAD
jgi:hypothetical protein